VKYDRIGTFQTPSKRVLRQKAIDELRAAVQEGLNSGSGENLDIETIIQRAKASRHAGHKG
jgi:Arc/MetJ-type ribon-helix-helix transcriptional regulator